MKAEVIVDNRSSSSVVMEGSAVSSAEKSLGSAAVQERSSALSEDYSSSGIATGEMRLENASSDEDEELLMSSTASSFNTGAWDDGSSSADSAASFSHASDTSSSVSSSQEGISSSQEGTDSTSSPQVLLPVGDEYSSLSSDFSSLVSSEVSSA
ncbi:MAG: hypothetical protein WCG83_06395, partial [Candidatus Peregrinibacteria bacterium]